MTKPHPKPGHKAQHDPSAIAPTPLPADTLQLAASVARGDPARWPARGDLAHIALAGRCMVPHYAVPLPHRLRAEATLCPRAGADDAPIAMLAAGVVFDVLDIAGGWAWGQVSPDTQALTGDASVAGLVGYLPIAALEPLAA